MTETLFALRAITKQYGRRNVLQIDELDICHGEILALVGPSGAGKSTLLRLLNFLEMPTTGAITFRGQEVTGQRAVPLDVRRRVTTVFQRPTLLRRSVYANVAYGLRLRGQRNATAEISATLEQVGLAELAQQPARTLSGGEAQRVALARAMVIDPDALLLDEPTANLDPYNVGIIERIVSARNRERQTTTVLITHNIFQARRLAHRVAFLLDGRIIEVAPAEEFFQAPRDQRTQAFIKGEMVY
ncbi:MAG: phosphate ABC transporter ATP-binding protein [Caldilineaceae bacterium]|nr:phosphate ABC transporter ATP-binding protein [Caldilineaceae bacterium]